MRASSLRFRLTIAAKGIVSAAAHSRKETTHVDNEGYRSTRELPGWVRQGRRGRCDQSRGIGSEHQVGLHQGDESRGRGRQDHQLRRQRENHLRTGWTIRNLASPGMLTSSPSAPALVLTIAFAATSAAALGDEVAADLRELVSTGRDKPGSR